jgi:SAM-dependent methyltransferase
LSATPRDPVATWRDREDRPVSRPPPPGPGSPPFYARIGDIQGPDYRRNAFARHTDHEVAVLRRELALTPGSLVLDVGCADARHLRALARDGIHGIGLDVSLALLRAAAAAALDEGVADRLTLVLGDGRRTPLGGASVDAAICLNQGGFGTHPETDRDVLAGVARALRPGGRLALTAYHALFAARHLAPGDALDPIHLVHHQRSEVRGPDDRREELDLWTTVYTARGLVDLVRSVGLAVRSLRGAEPGRYGGEGVGLDDPELLLLAERVT